MNVFALTITMTTGLLFAGISASGQSSGSTTHSASSVAHFPIVKASNLEKRELSLPADFEGERNLLLVAFEREQQKNVDTWLREMKHF